MKAAKSKNYHCWCGKGFATYSSMVQHENAAHQSMDKAVAKDVFECVAADLPDGAYLAMAGEFGLDPEDLV
jgi:hypothetical protein